MRSASKQKAFLTLMTSPFHFPALGVVQPGKGKVKRLLAREPSDATGGVSEAIRSGNILTSRCRCALQIALSFFLLTAFSLYSQPLDGLRREANTTLRMPPNSEDPSPPTLADTGAFSNLVLLTPNPGIVRYDLNIPFWSDGAYKTR